MDILCFGQQNWDFCWTGKQHLMTRLARRGHRILYVDRRPSGQRLATWPLVRQISSGNLPGLTPLPTGARGSLWVFTPQTFAALGWRRSEACRLHHLRLAMRHIGLCAEAMLVLHPYAFPLAEKLPVTGTVFYGIDEYSAYGTNVANEESEIRDFENRMIDRAQICLAISPRLLARYHRRHPRSFLLPSGADVDHFAPGQLERFRPHPDLQGAGTPVLGFIGQVDERLDQDLLRTLAQRQPQWQFALAGRIKEGLDLGRLKDLPNVRFLGYQPHEYLPRIARAVDVWLVPYHQTDLTHSCNPMKVYEYLATGRPIVATPLDGLADVRKGIALAEGIDPFERAIQAALANPERARAERLAMAEQLNWENRVDALEEFLMRAVELGAGADGRPRATGKIIAARKAARARLFPSGVNEYGQWIECSPPRFADRSTARCSRLAGSLFHAGRFTARALRGNTPCGIRRILVLSGSRLGELIGILPMMAALRSAFPKAHLSLAIQPGTDFGFLLNGMADEIIHRSELCGKSAKRLSTGWSVFRQGFDLVLSGSRPSTLNEELFSGAAIFAIDNETPWQALAGRVLPRDVQRHEVDNHLQLIKPLTGTVAAEKRIPALRFGRAETLRQEERVRRLLSVPPHAPLLLVHPGARRQSRRWPADLFAQTLQRLMTERPALQVILTGTADETEQVRAVAEKLSPDLRRRLQDLSGRTRAEDICALLRRVDAVLCNHTGVLHLARALDVPLAVIGGPENHLARGPYPLGRAPAVMLRREVPCSPCALDTCLPQYCLQSLAPERVGAVVGRLLDGQYPKRSRPEPSRILDVSRLSWRRLQELGFSLPLVSVLLLPTPKKKLADSIDRMLGNLEPQSYPHIELLVSGEGDRVWQDRRDAPARRRLPIRQPCGAFCREEALRNGIREAGGELIACFDARDQTGWWRERLSADVAAWMREPRAFAYRDGIPQRSSGNLEELLGQTVPAVHLRRLLAIPPANEKRSYPRPIVLPAD